MFSSILQDNPSFDELLLDFLDSDFLDSDFLDSDFLDADFLDADFLDADFLEVDFLDADFLDSVKVLFLLLPNLPEAKRASAIFGLDQDLIHLILSFSHNSNNFVLSLFSISSSTDIYLFMIF